ECTGDLRPSPRHTAAADFYGGAPIARRRRCARRSGYRSDRGRNRCRAACGPARRFRHKVRKIGHCRSCVVGTPSYFAAHGRPKVPGDLIEHQAVIYEQRPGGPTWTFRQGTIETTVTARGRLRVSAAEGVRERVHADLGLSIGG